MRAFNRTSDRPRSFGYKVSWFAVRTSDPAAVVEALGLEDATPANWESGLEAAQSYDASPTSDRWAFVSPPVDGWVLAVSAAWPYPDDIETQNGIKRRFDASFSRLMKRFDDVQFFGSDRRVGFVAWARALKGETIRVFAFAEEVMENIGDQTVEEAQLGFADLSGLSPSDAGDKIFAMAEEREAEEETLVATGISRSEARVRGRANGRDTIPEETDVVDLAALWSIDPTQLGEQDRPPGLGLAARLPKTLDE